MDKFKEALNNHRKLLFEAHRSYLLALRDLFIDYPRLNKITIQLNEILDSIKIIGFNDTIIRSKEDKDAVLIEYDIKEVDFKYFKEELKYLDQSTVYFLYNAICKNIKQFRPEDEEEIEVTKQNCERMYYNCDYQKSN